MARKKERILKKGEGVGCMYVFIWRGRWGVSGICLLFWLREDWLGNFDVLGRRGRVENSDVGGEGEWREG